MSNPNIFKDLLGGGACNPDGSQSMAQTSNPLKNFFQEAMLGRGHMKGKMEGFFPDEPMIQHPEQFQQEWDLMAKEFQNSQISGKEMHKMFEQQWRGEQMRMEEMRRMHEFEQRKAWEGAQIQAKMNEQNQIAMEKMMGEQWGNAELRAEAKDWKDDYFSAEFQGVEKDLEDAFQSAQETVDKKANEAEVIKELATYMGDVLENDPDPRFKNSKLLGFLKKLNTGEYEIKENQLIKNTMEGEFGNAWEEAKIETKMDNVWEKANMEHAWAGEEHKFDNPEAETEKVFDKIWKKFQAGEMPAPEDELEEEYQKIMAKMQDMENGNMEDIFADMWNVEQDIEEYQLYSDVPEAYAFNAQNPFMNDPKALELASTFLNKGSTREAILALESHLQQHPNDHASWRVLGKIHMDNDQDRPAVRCFLNSVNLQGTNLDNLLALGISCTNILDEVQAMNHLKHWMMNNPNYKEFVKDPNVVPENLVGKSITTEEIRMMSTRLHECFEAARMKNPGDPDLSTCIAVLSFIQRDYHASVNFFNEALKHDPNNYSLWNKLGATLAHLGRSNEAIEAYGRALEFKPNYVRAWVNLGIAHVFQGQFKEGISFYLSALSMNPEARHIWSYLQTAVLSLQRYDLLKLIAEQNLEAFKAEFDVTTVEDLPPPEIAYKQISEQFLVKERTEDWVKQFGGN